MSMNAQQFPAQPGDQQKIAEMLTGWKPALGELRRSVLASVSTLFSELSKRVDDLAALTSGLAAAVANIQTLVGQQVSPGLGSTTETNFLVPPGNTIRAAGTVAIPSGFTSAIVDVSVYAGAVDSLGGVKYIYVSAVINGVAGHEGIGGNDPASVAWVWATSRKVSILSGLTPGGVITFGVNMRTSDTATWGANTSNRAYCDASVTFLR